MSITEDHLCAARSLLLERRPFLAPLLLRCHLLLVDGAQVFCDRDWRIYVGRHWPPMEEAAGRIGYLALALYHELLHLVQNHFGRGGTLLRSAPQRWLVACELEINDDLQIEVHYDQAEGNGGLEMPPGTLLPELFNLPAGMCAEQYFYLLPEINVLQTASISSLAGGDMAATTAGMTVDVHGGRCEKPGTAGRLFGSDDRWPTIRGCCGGGSGTGLPAHALESSQGDTQLSPPDELERAVAWRQFAELAAAWHERTRGTQPGWMQRLAMGTVRRRPLPWYHLLERHLRCHALGGGMHDYTWRRPPRRDPFCGDLLLPSLVGLRPGDLGLLVDTSGSMSNRDLDQVFAVVKQILRRVCAAGGGAVHFLVCDTAAKYAGRICSCEQLASLELPRGGGTDLRVGMALAATLPLRCLLVLTDGYSPWPEARPKFPVVVALVGGAAAGVPPWAARVIVPAV